MKTSVLSSVTKGSFSRGPSASSMEFRIIVAIGLFILFTYFALIQNPRQDPYRQPTLIEHLLLPIEDHAFTRLPLITGRLNDVFALPGSQLLWAVGDGGLIVHSDDGGDFWSQQPTPIVEQEPSVLNAVPRKRSESQPPQKSVDGLEDSAVRYSEDAEQRAAPSSPALNAREVASEVKSRENFPSKSGGGGATAHGRMVVPNLSAVTFFDSEVGLAVGSFGVIFRTEDGGANWRPQKNRLPNINFKDVQRLSDNEVLAVGSRGVVLKSADRGKNWQRQNSPVEGDLSSIYVVDVTKAYLANALGELIRTNNGGDRWEIVDRDDYRELRDLGLASVDVYAGTRSLQNRRSQNSLSPDKFSRILSVDGAWSYTTTLEGQVLRRRDAGQTWDILEFGSQENTATLRINDLALVNSSAIIGVGDSGVIIKADLAFAQWQRKTQGGINLDKLAGADTLTQYRMADNGQIEFSKDRGRSWAVAEYSRYPAVWYWFVCLIFLLFALAVAVTERKGMQPPTPTVADILASDRPLKPGDPDPLAFGSIARGLSRFMRNRNTEPPLTVAITGAWGTGKSSLMNLLYFDLKNYGFTPVWFNAWHHQKGEQLLASLYANIRTQAIPGWLSFSRGIPVGFLFRLNLLFHRSRRRWLLSLVLFVVFVAATVHLFRHPEALAGLNLSALSGSNGRSDSMLDSLLVLLLGNIAPLAALIRAMRAFGVKPSSLVTLATGNSAPSNGVDPGARQQFAQEFESVTRSLDLGRMVIFIDDLDRCDKENIVDILEAINFLSVSGECYIVLGMDEKWVKLCIEDHFPKMSNNNPEFAEQYLEKMLNIKVPVPTLDMGASEKLLMPAVEADIENTKLRKILDAWHHYFLRYRQMLVVFSILACAVVLGWNMESIYRPYFPSSHTDSHQTSKTFDANTKTEVEIWSHVEINRVYTDSTGKPTLLLSECAEPPCRYATPNDTELEAAQDTEFELLLRLDDKALSNGVVVGRVGKPGKGADIVLSERSEGDVGGNKVVAEALSVDEDVTAKSSLKSSAGLLGKSGHLRPGLSSDERAFYIVPSIILFMLGFGAMVFLLREPERVIEDSSGFREALRIWHPWIMLKRQTPRAIKRYLNRVRYMAMRYRKVSRVDEPSGLAAFFTSKRKRTVLAENFIDEPTLVALSAIFAANEEWLIDDDKFSCIKNGDLSSLMGEMKFGLAQGDEKGSQAMEKNDPLYPLAAAVKEHIRVFGAEVFEQKNARLKFLDVLSITKFS